MKRALVAALLALVFDVAAIGQQPRPFSEERFGEGLRTAHFISDVLARAQASGSIEYNGKCGPGFLVPDLPPIHEPQGPYSQNPVDTFRSVSSVDRGMTVSQERNGIIRIVEAGVQTDILQVAISHLSFNRTTNPDEAFSIVLSAPEVQSFIQTHGIGRLFNSYHPASLTSQGLSASPRTGLPSISGELNNVTLADALDYVLKTFPGFWLYQNCESFEGQRIVYFGLFPVPGRMWMWDVQTLVI
jgi:hypothetical protein